jgi:hypothetical protein
MGIIGSTLIVALGAILAFGVDLAVPDANLRVIGIILMVLGAVAFFASVAISVPRRRARDEQLVRRSDGSEEHVVHDREVI